MFGVYVHIPFCLQRCRYCDFATYSEDQIKVNSAYIDTLLMEVEKQKGLYSPTFLNTIYFGGGTPSLLSADDIKRFLSGLRNQGFNFDQHSEVTIEINPATVSEEKLHALLEAGINRMSVGAQTFNDSLLKVCGRKHSADDTLKTVELLQKYNTNLSLDFLFALPGQTLKDIDRDIELFTELNPNHISPYCLTLPTKHPMNQNRPEDDTQTEMFSRIWHGLQNKGYLRYEISNFAKPGFESQHNSLYWRDFPYWGIGLSAHSYQPQPDWGYRFWNPSDYQVYCKTVKERPLTGSLPDDFFARGNFEKLETHQSLTDFCHTALRTSVGLAENSLRQKYGSDTAELVSQRLSPLIDDGLIESGQRTWTLSDRGVLLSNLVFSKLLFVDEDIDKKPGGLIINESNQH